MNPNSPKKERKFRHYLTVEFPEEFSDVDVDRAKMALEEFCNTDLTFFVHRKYVKISKVSYITNADK